MSKQSLLVTPAAKAKAIKDAKIFIENKLQFVAPFKTPAPSSVPREELESLQNALDYYKGKGIDNVIVVKKPEGVKLTAYINLDFELSTLNSGNGNLLRFKGDKLKAFNKFHARLRNRMVMEGNTSLIGEVYMKDDTFTLTDIFLVNGNNGLFTVAMGQNIYNAQVLKVPFVTINTGGDPTNIEEALGKGSYLVRPEEVDDELTFVPELVVRDEKALRLAYGDAINNPQDLDICIKSKNIRYAEQMMISQFKFNYAALDIGGANIYSSSDTYEEAIAEANANKQLALRTVDSRLIFI